MTERVWNIMAVLFLFAGAVFLWLNNLAAAFVTATLGVVAWFLSYRSQTRAKIPTETEAEPIDEADEN